MKILLGKGQLNTTELAQEAGSNYVNTLKRLKKLQDEGILEQRLYGKTRLFRFNEHSPKANAIIDVLQVWEQQTLWEDRATSYEDLL